MFFPRDDGFSILSHIVNAAAYLHAKLAGPRLGDSDRCNFRLRINAARHDRKRNKHAVWHSLQTDGVRLSGQVFNHIGCLRHSYVRQLGFCRNIADGINAGLARLEICIDYWSSLLHLQRHVFAKKAIRIRSSSYRYHDLVGLDLGNLIRSKVTHRTDQAVFLADFLHHGIAVNGNALIGQLLFQCLGDLFIHRSQQMRTLLYDSHL